jgi:thioredoxin reductase (NADPH)
MGNVVTYDVVIVGAGPAGLFAAYYAGFRGMKTAMFDGLPQVGGQISTMYPEKKIHDVAGFASIKGSDFVAQLLEQSQRHPYDLFLSETVTSFVAEGEAYRLTTDKGRTVLAKSVVISAGLGKCEPRTLPDLESVTSANVMHFVPDLSVLEGQDVVVAGGGDSAVDWALAAVPLARSVTVIHRRNRFRAHEGSVKDLHDSSATVIAPGEVVGYRVEGGQEILSVSAGKDDVRDIVFGKFVMALGFISDLSGMADWGLQIDGYRIPVRPDMQTCLPRVYAIGDISEYDGKVRLMAVGFGEAAIAVNHAVAAITPGTSVLPGHSTSQG